MAEGAWDHTASILSAWGDKDAKLDQYNPYRARQFHRSQTKRFSQSQKDE